MGLTLHLQGSEFTWVQLKVESDFSRCSTLEDFLNILFSLPPKAALCILDFIIPLMLHKDARISFHTLALLILLLF